MTKARSVLGEGGQFEFRHPFGEAVEAGDPLVDLVVPGGEFEFAGHDLGGEQGGGLFGIRFAALAGAQHEVAKADHFLLQHAPLGVVPHRLR